MKKYNFFLVIVASLSLTNIQHAMQPTITKATEPFIKHLAKKIFSKTMTGLHWTIAAGDSFYTGATQARILFNEEKKLKKLDNATPEVKNFIISTIDSHNIENVKVFNYNAPMGVFRKHILLSYKTADEIEKALINNDQITLNKWRGTLEHENSHLQHNDLAWRAATTLVMPFATHTSIRAIRNIIPIAKKTRSFLTEQLIKIPTAIGKNIITISALATFIQQQEQRADNDVSDDIDKLIGFKTVLEEGEKGRIAFFTKIFPSITPMKYKIISKTLNFFEQHPLPEKRIAKINKRIDLLQNPSLIKKYDDSQYYTIEDKSMLDYLC